MNTLFTTIANKLDQNVSLTIAIKHNKNGKLTVCSHFKNADGSNSDIPSFNLVGTPQELDAGYLEAIETPMTEVNGLISNLEEFKKGLKQAEKNAKTNSPANKIAAATSDNTKKWEEERKRKEAEAKAKKENFDKCTAEAKKENARGNYFLAEFLLRHALTQTDDKKVKADIEKQIKAIVPNQSGFLCNDDPDIAKAAFEAFVKTLAKPEAPVSEPATAPADEEQPEESEENGTETEEGDSEAQEESEEEAIEE